jgi:hypothetical protein
VRRCVVRTEMDVMRMDERQRLHWLAASRATLITVGVVWLLMIAWELLQRRLPMFLIVMVPVFAAVRLGFYRFYARDRENRLWVRVLFFVVIAVGHFLAMIVAAVGEFCTSGFLGLFPEPPHAGWIAALNVLEFPILTIAGLSGPLRSSLHDAAMVANSLLWAAVIYSLVSVGLRRTAASGDAELWIAA